MQYPNLYSGVKKLFAAEILQIIGYVVLTLGLAFALTAVVADQQGAGEEIVGGALVGAVMFTLPAAIIILIGEIMLLVGLWQGGKDEPNYMKKAFWAAIIMVVLNAVVGAMTGSSGEQSMASNVISLISCILGLVVINFSVEGIGQAAASIGRGDLLQYGHKLMTLLTIALACALVTAIAVNWVGQVAAVVSLVLLIVVYFGYLVFLSRAKKVFA